MTKGFQVSFDISQDGDNNANAQIYYFDGAKVIESLFQAESLDQLIPIVIQFLKDKNLPHPDPDDLSIEEEAFDYRYTYWEF